MVCPGSGQDRVEKGGLYVPLSRRKSFGSTCVRYGASQKAVVVGATERCFRYAPPHASWGFRRVINSPGTTSGSDRGETEPGPGPHPNHCPRNAVPRAHLLRVMPRWDSDGTVSSIDDSWLTWSCSGNEWESAGMLRPSTRGLTGSSPLGCPRGPFFSTGSLQTDLMVLEGSRPGQFFWGGE